MMNIFRLCADLTHLASIFILLLKIKQSRSCVGEFSYSTVRAVFYRTKKTYLCDIFIRYFAQDSNIIPCCVFNAICRCYVQVYFSL